MYFLVNTFIQVTRRKNLCFRVEDRVRGWFRELKSCILLPSALKREGLLNSGFHTPTKRKRKKHAKIKSREINSTIPNRILSTDFDTDNRTIPWSTFVLCLIFWYIISYLVLSASLQMVYWVIKLELQCSCLDLSIFTSLEFIFCYISTAGNQYVCHLR